MRAWRIALRITALNFRARMEYRSDFVAALLMGLAWQSSVLVFADVLLSRFPGLGGWDQGGVLLIVSIRLLAHGIVVAVFGSLQLMPGIVQQGLIDGYLVRPMPVYRQVLLYQFPMNAIGDSTAAVAIFVLALTRLHLAWTVTKVMYMVAAVAGGALIEGAVQTLVSTLAFRAAIGMSVFMWFDSMIGTFGNYPLSILPVAARSALTFVLPVAFVAYLPAAVLTGRIAETGMPYWLAVCSPAVGLLLYVTSRFVWFSSLRRYESVGG